ncbi:MAG: hypothetical protein FWE76_06720 [Symbiobacteriaceae bacterium]|nr:hypothetical protein [Symbiobacteriaceae bacterium]
MLQGKMDVERRDAVYFNGIIFLCCLVIGVLSMMIRYRAEEGNLGREARWQQDINQIKNDLFKYHPRFSQSLEDMEEFDLRLTTLGENVDHLADREILAELTQIISRDLGDSHSYISDFATFYPLQFFCFSEGIFVKGSTASYHTLIGKELTGINGVALSDAISGLERFLNNDNTWIARDLLARALSDPHLLFIAGLSAHPSDEVQYLLDDEWINMMPVFRRSVNHKNTVYARGDLDLGTDLSQYKSARFYWHTFLESNVCYLKINRCHDDPYLPPFAGYIEQLFAEIDRLGSPKLIIDLRDNSGGFPELIHSSLMAEIKARPRLNNRDALRVIIGRSTFSGGTCLAYDLKQDTNCLVIGEPSGQKLPFFADPQIMRTRYMAIPWLCSTRFYDDNEDGLRILAANIELFSPDIEVSLHARDWFEGHDSFLEEALR